MVHLYNQVYSELKGIDIREPRLRLRKGIYLDK